MVETKVMEVNFGNPGVFEVRIGINFGVVTVDMVLKLTVVGIISCPSPSTTVRVFLVDSMNEIDYTIPSSPTLNQPHT
jgi:hypothetical protein